MVDPLGASPSVTNVSPNFGSALGGDAITITGSKLAAAIAVTFGSVEAEFVVDSDGSITAISPAQDAGIVDVTVTTSGGTSATGLASKFTYKPVPVIDAISPNSGPGGTSVTITGSAFGEVDSVTFGDVAAEFVIDSDTAITTIAPAHPNGAVDITISTPDGNTAVSDADAFIFTGAVSTDLIGVTIRDGKSLSSAVDCTQKHPLVVIMPEGWDAAVLSFCISIDDINYYDLYQRNTELFVNVTPGTATVIPPEWFVVDCYVKFRSGTSAKPVAQKDDRTFMVVLN